MNPTTKTYERAVTPIERLFTRSPFSIVTMVARIKGQVTEDMLREALNKVCMRHVNLRTRIVDDVEGNPRFTSAGARAILVEVMPRESDEQWLQVLEEVSQVPFEFSDGPAIRFILLQEPTCSDLLIVSHHINCDGMSLAFLARDVMHHLGDASRQVERLSDPVLMDLDTLPAGASVNPLVKAVVRRINKKWQQERVIFDQDDYRELTAAYWSNYHHATLPIELSEEQTSQLVARCKAENVTVNTALTAAFVDAQTLVQGEKPSHASIGIAVSLRDRLRDPAGEAMGFYAGVASFKNRRRSRGGFWDATRRLHRKVKPLLRGQSMMKDPIIWCHLDPTIIEAMNFKKLGHLVPEDAPRHQKLASFAKRNDVVQGLLKRGQMESVDRVFMGTAVTNLGRLDFPKQYGTLELDRLILQPGGAFPLSQVGLVVGAVTCSGKLSLVLEYAKEAVDASTMQKVSEKALELLLDDPS